MSPYVDSTDQAETSWKSANRMLMINDLIAIVVWDDIVTKVCAFGRLCYVTLLMPDYKPHSKGFTQVYTFPIRTVAEGADSSSEELH